MHCEIEPAPWDGATSNSAAGFGGKIGSGIGASLIGWMLAVAGYDSSLAEAIQATKMAIYGFSFVVPLLMFILMVVLVSRFDLEIIVCDAGRDRYEKEVG